MRYDATRIGPKPLDVLIEDARIAALRSYRQISASDRSGLSRLCGEAARSLAASHAAVSFVDETRAWFAGAFGFDAEDAPRAGFYCDLVVRSGMPLLVSDGREDHRVRHHPLVQADPFLRSYAGVPLADGGGYVLGTVAVFSMSRDAFEPAVLDRLGGLAALVRDYLGDARPVSAPPVRKVQGWLGIKAAELKSGRDDELGGLLVVSVSRRSPANDAGLRPTDILHAIDGDVLTAIPDIAAAMAGRPIGSPVHLRFRRGGQWHEATVTVRPQRRRIRG